MTTLLHRLGGLAYRRPLPFVIVWLLILGSVIGLAVTSGGRISSSMTIDGTPSQQVIDQLHKELPAASGGQGTIVFTVPEGERLDTGERAAAIARGATDITALPVVVDRSTAKAQAPGAQAPGATTSSRLPNATRMLRGSRRCRASPSRRCTHRSAGTRLSASASRCSCWCSPWARSGPRGCPSSLR